MANPNESIDQSLEQLTAALQQLTAELAESPSSEVPKLPQCLPASELSFSEGVESFVQGSREYAEKTRSVSVGTY